MLLRAKHALQSLEPFPESQKKNSFAPVIPVLSSYVHTFIIYLPSLWLHILWEEEKTHLYMVANIFQTLPIGFILC